MEIRLDELVSLLEGELLAGDPAALFTGVASLDEAGPDDASFLGNEKYVADFNSTRAGVVIVSPGVTGGPEGVALVSCENPTFAFSKVVARFAAGFEVEEAPGVHPQAIVADGVSLDPATVSIGPGAVIEEGVVIGKGSRIGAGSVICRDAVLGDDCLLHAKVVVRERCELGSRVIVQPGAVIGSDGYGYEQVEGRHVKIPQVGIVVVGDDVEIGANAAIDRARFGKTVIGEGSKIDNLVQIAHNVRIGKHCLVVAQCGIAGSTELKDYVVLAGQAGSVGHVTIDTGVVLTARSVAAKDLDVPGEYFGFPARPKRDELKGQAALRKLPELLKEVQRMRKEIEDLKKG